MLRKKRVWILLIIFGAVADFFCANYPRTSCSIVDGKWHINRKVTYPGTPAEGLLMNVRMVNATFEDANKPDLNPEANVAEFIAHIPAYLDAGVRAFTLNLQGGMPGYEGAVNSAFSTDGTLRQSYLTRIERVIKACDQAGAAVILGCFYQRQDQILADEKAVRQGVINTVKWLRKRGFRNVLLEIANEFPHRGFDYKLIRSPEGMVSLIELAKKKAPDLLVSASGYGNGKMDSTVAEAADFILIHFNGTPVDDIAERVHALKHFGKPIVCNEDDKLGSKAVTAMRASVNAGASWGFMHKEHNQYEPFNFNGMEDDPLVYRALKDITRKPGISSAEFLQEAWKLHGIRPSDNGRYGLLWWLFEEEGGCVISGAGHAVCAVVPENEVAVTVMRNHVGPNPGPFNYYNDKRTLVLFGGRL